MSGKRGKLFVIAAPSGAGKTSLVRALMQLRPTLRFSISYTTRKQRPNERHSHDYFFVDKAEFERMVAAGDFLEHARVFDNYYGTSRQQVEQLLDESQDVLLEIDWQGAQQIRRALPECRSIFVLPPSREALEQRLRGRGTDSDEVIARRLRDSLADLSHWSEFDYIVVNDDFDRATADLQAIVTGQGEQLRRDRPELRELLARLLA
ncbi:MAG TPA: guanylate kinase [Steroidobacteraceae bacterium]|jgi:guanylate kinase|nr:guanylate kinase [Steroidobacteraceae bacterium]